MKNSTRFEHVIVLPYIAKWLLLSSLVAILAGSASALFLFLLDHATATRLQHPWLLWLLPVAGFIVSWCYLLVGQNVEAGNNLLIDEIHDPQKVVEFRMAPLVMIATVISHLFGASVGREGTAVQMGGSLADQLTKLFKLSRDDRRVLLMTGISAGFSSVFGTPLAGAIFGLEVLAMGRMRYDAIFSCFIAAVGADYVTLHWGIHHTLYSVGVIPLFTPWHVCAMIIAGGIFGLVGKGFAAATHRLGTWFKQKIAYSPLRALAGGLVIALVAWSCHGEAYIGLGIPSIQSAFLQPVAPYEFLAKFGFTVSSLASGFKGGEVTPLFYIGATLGNALAPLLHLPFAVLAGVGFVAVFAGAANTPIASTFMAMEMFGSEIGIYAGIACVVSYMCSGYACIYRSQRVGTNKLKQVPEDIKLADLSSLPVASRQHSVPSQSLDK